MTPTPKEAPEEGVEIMHAKIIEEDEMAAYAEEDKDKDREDSLHPSLL